MIKFNLYNKLCTVEINNNNQIEQLQQYTVIKAMIALGSSLSEIRLLEHKPCDTMTFGTGSYTA